MTAFDLDHSRRWLICLTHPDDEISICAWLRRLARNGNDVFLSWTHSNPIREREARSVAQVLGIPDRNLFFFRATDGSACDEIPQLLPRFRDLMSEVRPSRVACGAFEQGHLDHDATNYLVNRSFGGPVLEIPFYHTYLKPLQTLNRFSDPRGQEVYELDLDDQALKTLVARMYPSQTIWRILFWHETLHRMCLRPAELAKTERMRWQSHSDFMLPNHPEALARAVAASASWQRWVRAIGCVEPAQLEARLEPLSAGSL